MHTFDFETKYIAPNIKAQAINSWMSSNLELDTEYPEAIISSVYFESKDFQFLKEKEASDHIKSKFRIRWYEDVITKEHSDICFLEFKHKVNNQRYKRRNQIENKYSHLPLESSEFINSLNKLRVFNSNILKHIYPIYTITYHRNRYIAPSTNQRICIDYNIHLKNINTNMLNKNIKPINLNHCVLETKGLDQRLPRELHFLENFGLKKSSFSKYERCFYELLYEDN